MRLLGRRSQAYMRVSRPVGRVLCPRSRGAAAIHLGLSLPTASCGLPASIGRAALDRSRREPPVPLLTLLRVGFTEPPQSPAALVVSYTTVSPLPPTSDAGAVCFLWHCPAGRPGSALPITLPCGARTFLTGPAPGAAARPTHPRSGYAEGHPSGVGNRAGADEGRERFDGRPQRGIRRRPVLGENPLDDEHAPPPVRAGLPVP